MSASVKTESANSELALAELLFRVENEIRMSVEVTANMQQSASRNISTNKTVMKLLSDEMQALDLLHQTLDGVADFISALAKEAPDNWRLDPENAYSVLKLEKLVAGLKGQSHIDECSDDVDLF